MFKYKRRVTDPFDSTHKSRNRTIGFLWGDLPPFSCCIRGDRFQYGSLYLNETTLFLFLKLSKSDTLFIYLSTLNYFEITNGFFLEKKKVYELLYVCVAYFIPNGRFKIFNHLFLVHVSKRVVLVYTFRNSQFGNWCKKYIHIHTYTQ